VFVNDLPNALKFSSIRLFADDANNFTVHTDLQILRSNVEKDFKNINDWMCANKLSLNVDKTNFTIFSPYMHKPEFNIFNEINCNTFKVYRVPNVTYLGVIIDEKLSWKQHIDSVCKKLRQLTSVFYKVRKKIPQKLLKDLYFAFAYSKIQYAVEVYANTSNTLLQPLVILNNRILRILQFRPIRTYNSELYKSYATLPVTSLHEYKLLLLLYKFIRFPALLPRSYDDYFKFNVNVYNYRTRNCFNFHLERFSTSYGRRKLHYHAVILWNALPAPLKLINNLNMFKKRLKLHFLCMLR
jgi:hypothetical protein